MFNRLVINRGLENKVNVKGLAKKFGIKWVIISIYYSLANRIVEYSYCPIKDALLKMMRSSKRDWLKNLPIVLLTDRTTIKTIIDFSSFRLIYRIEAILLIKLEVPI
jgi:hypothetical protein